jgi:hypothetical protein
MPDKNGAFASHQLLIGMLILPVLTFVVTYAISISNGTQQVLDPLVAISCS